MSEKNPASKFFGSLCNQLIRMCQKSRNQRVSELKSIRRSSKIVPSEELTQLISANSIIGKNEQDSHEEFYRLHYENSNQSA